VKPIGRARLMVCLIAVDLRLAAPGQARGNVESLAEINRKPPEQRLKALAREPKRRASFIITAQRTSMTCKIYSQDSDDSILLLTCVIPDSADHRSSVRS